MLVVTPKPLLGESLVGYLLHLTEANGYPSTSYIISSLNGRWYGSSVGRLNASPLMELARLSQLEVERLSMLPTTLPRAFVRVFGNDLPSYEVNSRAPKVCPLCLNEGRRCEAFWDLAQAAGCPRHGVTLVSMCPDCDKPLRWSRKKVGECACGSDITGWSTQPISPQLRDLMGLMRFLTYRGEDGSRAPESMQHLAHLTLRQCCKLTWVLTYVVREGERVRNRFRSKARNTYRKELECVAQLLSDWPRNFRSFLDEQYADVVLQARPLPPFSSTFAWLCNGLIAHVEGGEAAFKFVGDEVFRFATGHWTRNSVPAVLGPDLAPTAVFRWGTRNEACELLGFHMNTLKKMIAAGEIPVKRTAARGASRTIVVDLAFARALQQSRFPAISVRDAAKQVGVSIETLKAMWDSGLYEQRHRPSFPGSLTVEDVEHLADRLLSLVQGKRQVRGDAILNLTQAFHRFGASPAEKAAVFRWLVDDPAHVIGRMAKDIGMERIQVEANAIGTFLAGIRDEDSCVTLRTAARQLGCSDGTVTALKRSGHLECKKVRGRVHPRKGSLAKFHSEYVLLKHLANEAGVASKRIYARMDFSKIRYLRVKTVQYQTVFVHRADTARVARMIQALR